MNVYNYNYKSITKVNKHENDNLVSCYYMKIARDELNARVT